MSECPCERDKSMDPHCCAAGMCVREDDEMEQEFPNRLDHGVVCEACGWSGRLGEADLPTTFQDGPTIKLNCPKCNVDAVGYLVPDVPETRN